MESYAAFTPKNRARWESATQIMSAIGEVLRDHDITVSEQVEVISQCKPGCPNNGDKLRPTLFIEVDMTIFIDMRPVFLSYHSFTSPTGRSSMIRTNLFIA